MCDRGHLGIGCRLIERLSLFHYNTVHLMLYTFIYMWLSSFKHSWWLVSKKIFKRRSHRQSLTHLTSHTLPPSILRLNLTPVSIVLCDIYTHSLYKKINYTPTYPHPHTCTHTHTHTHTLHLYHHTMSTDSTQLQDSFQGIFIRYEEGVLIDVCV